MNTKKPKSTNSRRVPKTQPLIYIKFNILTWVLVFSLSVSTVVNLYTVSLSGEQQKKINSLTARIDSVTNDASKSYDAGYMKSALDSYMKKNAYKVSEDINGKLTAVIESPKGSGMDINNETSMIQSVNSSTSNTTPVLTTDKLPSNVKTNVVPASTMPIQTTIQTKAENTINNEINNSHSEKSPIPDKLLRLTPQLQPLPQGVAQGSNNNVSVLPAAEKNIKSIIDANTNPNSFPATPVPTHTNLSLSLTSPAAAPPATPLNNSSSDSDSEEQVSDKKKKSSHTHNNENIEDKPSKNRDKKKENSSSTERSNGDKKGATSNIKATPSPSPTSSITAKGKTIKERTKDWNEE